MGEDRSGGVKRSHLVGVLLRNAREADPYMKKEYVAEQTGLGERTITSIESGEYERPRSYNVAKVALVVGVTPTQLRSVGRDDAADELADMILMRDAGMTEAELEFIAKVRAKLTECGSLGQFIDWVGMVAGDVIAHQHGGTRRSDVDGQPAGN